jgi:predicted DNA-binding transcriptional regulator YafY
MKSMDRLFGIFLLLKRGKYITAKELSSRFAVNERTIYRDIETIRRAGVPIASVPGPDGGYIIQEVLYIDPIIFSSDQTMGFFFNNAILPDFKSFDSSKILDRTLEKLADVLTPDEKRQITKSHDRIYFDTQEWYWRDRPEKDIQRLKQAVIGEEQLRIIYVERDDPNPMEAVVDPYGLVWKGGFWYLVGFSHLEKEFRRYRVQRINEIKETGNAFQRDEKFDLREFWRLSLESFGKGNIKVIIKISSRVTAEFEHFNWKTESKILKYSNYWLVEMWMDKYEWIIPLILSYGSNIEVIVPKALQKRVAEELQMAIKLYTDNSVNLVSEIPDTGMASSDIRSRATRGRINL